MGTTGFSTLFTFTFRSTLSSAFNSVFSFHIHPILGAALAGLGFWPKAERPRHAPVPSSEKANPETSSSHLPDSFEPPATQGKQAAQKSRSIETTQPLRVIRMVEVGMPAANTSKMAGRMFISGRMSDVCAELDRLAA